MSTPPLPNIPAAKNRLGDELIYWLLARWSLWSSFDRVWLQSHGPLPDPQDGPLLLYLNHGSWWDGYMVYVIHRMVLRRRFDSHLLMEEQQLRSYRFFTWSGAFSLNRHDRDDVQRSQAYTVDLLRDRRHGARSVFIFPQGRIVPQDQRPLKIYPGIARIAARVGGVTLCPVALRYEFLGQERPHAFIRIGPTHRAGASDAPKVILADIATRLTTACDALRDDVIAERLDRFAVLLRGSRGIDQRFDALLRLLPRRM